MPAATAICVTFVERLQSDKERPMAICIKCGKEDSSCLCEQCKKDIDIEKLCGKLISYKVGSGENLVWEKMAAGFYSSYNLKNLVFAISDDLPFPRKEYQRVMAIAGVHTNVPKYSRPWFYDIYGKIQNCKELEKWERNKLHGLALGAYYMDYDYHNAEMTATMLCESDDLPWQACYNLAEFYTVTRRYNVADEVISDALFRFSSDEHAIQNLQNCKEKNIKQREKAEAGKMEYLPNPKENRDEVRQKYIDFLAGIGIEASVPKARKKVPDPISRDQYPDPVETRDSDLSDFVAFDLETTGLSTRFDSIIEIGAIRVVNGVIDESAKFVFQELAKPFDRRVSEEVQQLTGITNDDIKDARDMWDVFADFMNFVGDDVLVGYNCMSFDSRFMVRAGRYANIIIRNKYFDVMHYADQFKSQLDIDAKKVSLGELSDKLKIENPMAHRALSDAITTARVFLKLKEMDGGGEDTSLDEMLSDLDNW